MSKKIIVSFSALSQGGAARVCANLSCPLCDRYDSVILLAWNNLPVFYDYDQRAKFVCVEKEVGSNSDKKKMSWFRRFVKSEKPHMILSFLEPYNLRVLISTFGLHIPVVVSERNEPHSVNKYWIMDQLEKLIYRLADSIVVQTPTIQRFFDGSLASKTIVLYNPVNLADNMVGKALVTNKGHRIVSVARLMPQKKHDVLIRAFAEFSTTHPNFILTVCGDGPDKINLTKLAASLGLTEKVFFPGNIKNVHEAILDADIMCLVSNREGMSNAMIEAMCLGLPCICTKVSGAVDLIRDGENGMLVDIGDIEGLTNKMSELADNEILCKTLGENASKLYNVLNKEKINKEWLSHLETFLK